MAIRIEKIVKIINYDLLQTFNVSRELEQLKNTVETIRTLLLNPGSGNKYQKVLQHFKREARRNEALSEKIAKKLYKLIIKLQKRIEREQKGIVVLRGENKRRRVPLTVREIQHLEAFKSQIQDCRRTIKRTLLHNGELHNLIKKSRWTEVKTKIVETLGTNNEPGIRYLAKLLRDLEIQQQHITKLYSSYDTIKVPAKCTKQQLNDFKKFVELGGEVTGSGLITRISNAYLLGFHYENGKLAAIAAIKKPLQSYIKKVFGKAGLQQKIVKYPLELGWIYTHQNFRRRGYCAKLVNKMYYAAGKKGTFSTTRINNVGMQKGLVKFGFKKVGRPYSSSRGNYQLVLFVKS